jgi:DNA polymerase elongation subunit (family B)
MIIANTKEGIHLRWRDENNERIAESISFNEFSPYFYIRADVYGADVSSKTIQVAESRKGQKTKVELTFSTGDYVNLEGVPLVKVTWSPFKTMKTEANQMTHKVKGYFHDRGIITYEADVQHHYRFAVDELEIMPEYNLRKWYWDMEWMQGGEHDGAITAIVVYDNFDDEYYTLTWLPDSNETERTVLERFILMIDEKDPDMLISWFGWKFDLPKWIERLDANGIDKRSNTLVTTFTDCSIRCMFLCL